ncbi:MAG TPA: hypothetical protein PK306_26755 [Aquabacterium sp.]|nr:hypothetical protein [Aquabacterium sp.]
MALLWTGPLDNGVQPAVTIGNLVPARCAGNIHTAPGFAHPTLEGRRHAVVSAPAAMCAFVDQFF